MQDHGQIQPALCGLDGLGISLPPGVGLLSGELKLHRWPREKRPIAFFSLFTLLSQQIIFSLEVTDFLFWWGLMSTPRKCLLALLGEQFTSMMQRIVGNAQISRNVR
jgi:hypothetical protein